jgi:hypothetical protein
MKEKLKTIGVIFILTFALNGNSISQESIDPATSKGPKEVICLVNAKVKIGGDGGVGVDIAFSRRTACKAASQAICVETQCVLI